MNQRILTTLLGYDTLLPPAPPRPTPGYRCDNCTHEEHDPPLARDLHDRLDEDGGRVTTHECSKCGSLSYKIMTTPQPLERES